MLSRAASLPTFATRSIVSPCKTPGSLRREVEVGERAVLLYELAVGVELTASAQVTYQIPVHARVVLPARLLVGAADGKVHRTAELLVEEDVLGRPADAVVGPYAKLPEIPGPLVRIEHGVEELLPLLGARLDDLATLEAEPHPQNLAPGDGHGDAEVDLP